MTATLTVPRPVAGDHLPYYDTYITKVGEHEDVIAVLADLRRSTAAQLASMSETQASHRYAPGKWSVREVIAHVADSERVFGYRLLSIARGDATPLPGFDENKWAEISNAETRPLADVAAEFAAVRDATLALVRSLDAAGWERRGTANGVGVAARSLPYIIAGHERHHLSVLAERYGVGR
ncbi:MAG: DinB family protein [Gemmatimonadales bacterium]